MTIFTEPFTFQAGYRPTENREAALSDLAIEQALERAETNAAATLTAAIEACMGLWERGLGSATCSRLTPFQLSMIGRRLLSEGEIIMLRERGRIGGVAATASVQGTSTNPSGWRYRITVASPNGKARPVLRPGTDVFHARIGVVVEQPWQGRSPLFNSSGTANILRAVELAMKYEAGGAVATVLPVPKPSTALATDVRNARGKTLLGHTTSANWGEGGRGPAGDWRPQRIAPTFAEYELAAHAAVQRSVAAACGVPPLLLGMDIGGGGDAREAWRQFVFSTLAPLGLLIEAELDRVGLPSAVSFEKLAASDLSGRSRAFQSLTKGGMERAKAELRALNRGPSPRVYRWLDEPCDACRKVPCMCTGQAGADRRHLWNARRLGRCPKCGAKAREGRRKCQRCAEVQRTAGAEWRAKCKAAGRCERCPAQAVDGKTQCRRCLDARAAKARAKRAAAH